MKFIYFIISIILINSQIKSQTPGYMGKRFNAGYGFYFSPALFGTNGAGQTLIGRDGNGETDELAFNTMHEGYFEYALKKRLSLGISGRYFKTTYDNAARCESYNNPTGIYNIKGVNYSFYGKLYKRNYVAPWGKYFVFGAYIKSFTTIYDPTIMTLIDYNNSTVSNFGPLKQRSVKFDILLGFGRSRIISNRVIIDYGFNTNLFSLLTTSFLLLELEGDGPILNSRYYTYNYIEKTAAVRIRDFNRFNAFIKIGYLF